MNDDTQTSKKSLEDQKIFDICRDIELKNAELYEYFGEVFQDDAEVSRLWFKTAEEERNHAAQFSLAAKLHTGITASSVDPWKAANTLKIVNSIFENVRGHRPTLLDALRSAMKLEENLSVFHLHCVGLFADESVKKMFDAMMKVDDAHVVKLKALHEKVLAKR